MRVSDAYNPAKAAEPDSGSNTAVQSRKAGPALDPLPAFRRIKHMTKPKPLTATDRSLKTVVILIGNSDNKLSQLRWAEFCEAVESEIISRATVIHFAGGPETCSPFQNFCWVALVPDIYQGELWTELHRLRRDFGQDSIAVIAGKTEFIKPI